MAPVVRRITKPDRIGRSGRNLLLSTGGEVITRGLAFLYVVALARHLKPAGFGIFSALLAYFALATALGGLGLDRLAVRELAGRVRRERTVFATLLWLRFGTATGTGLVLVVAGWVLKPDVAGPIAVLALAAIPAGIAAVFAARFQARERFGAPTAANIAAGLAMATLCLAGVVLERSLVFFIWAACAAEVVRCAVLVAVAVRERWGGALVFDASIARAAVRAMLPYGVLAVLGTVYFRIDLVMLDGLVGGDAVGHYAGAYRILEALLLVPALTLGVLYPRFAWLLRANPAAAGDLYLGAVRVLVWAGVVIALCGALLSKPLMRVLFHNDYVVAAPVLVWLMLALVFIFWHSCNATVLFASEDLGRVIGLSCLTMGFAVAANWVVIPYHGALGAAATTVASELVSLAVFTPLVCRRLGISGRRYVRALGRPRLTRAELDLILGVEWAEKHRSERHR